MGEGGVVGKRWWGRKDAEDIGVMGGERGRGKGEGGRRREEKEEGGGGKLKNKE